VVNNNSLKGIESDMKITFITGHLCKERHSLLYELALDLGKNGADVTVLTGFPSRRISEEVRSYYLENPIERISDNVVVKRIGSKRGEGTSLFIRMIKYVILTFALYKEAKRTPTDVYYIYSSPPFLGLAGAKLAKKVAPTLYNAQDLFPDTLTKIKHLSEKNPLLRVLRMLERKVYAGNTRIITISNEMKDTIARAGCDSEKIGVIYNWADIEGLHHVCRDHNKLFDELGIDRNKFIVSYAGDIGLFQGWSIILDAAKIVAENNPNIEFVIIGSGSYHKEMSKRIRTENITNVVLRPLQSANRLSEVYSIGDLELVPIEEGITKIALPSKTWVIMATGSPLLALVDQDSDIAKIIIDNELGYTLSHGSAERLAQVVLMSCVSQKKLKEFGLNCRDFANKNNSRIVQTKKYYSELEELSLWKGNFRHG
jgi:colanic acid biosynthesis glycosyl transferase WcaI